MKTIFVNTLFVLLSWNVIAVQTTRFNHNSGDSLRATVQKLDRLAQEVAANIERENQPTANNSIFSEAVEAVYAGFRYTKPRPLNVDRKIYHLKQHGVWVKSGELEGKFVFDAVQNKVYKALNTSTQNRMLFVEIEADPPMTDAKIEPAEVELLDAAEESEAQIDEAKAGATAKKASSNETAVAPQKNWSIYPNPASNELFVSNMEQGTAYQLLAIDGREVMADRLQSNSLNIEGLTPGIYLIRISNQTQKFIKR